MIVTTTHLEQRDRSELVPARPPSVPVSVTRVEDVAPEFGRFLYTAVGGDWHWRDRLGWTLRQWTEQLSRPGSETWVAWVRGAPAGYIELDGVAHDDGTHTEIAYFGLLPRHIGLGLGGHLLAHGIGQAWSLHERGDGLPAVTRVWVHTCTLDGPHALANYRARGLREYATTEAEEDVPAVPPGPWPGAR
ncbi:GNAT family N-acetyltransferase [Pseudonocardia nematodicida]|uniref:GNAT family N-acetyltransferase n=1 Tax=Pseudonocardia nematodicida TaxID=1206997 RepID=A0ABV1KC97_9PSEU